MAVNGQTPFINVADQNGSPYVGAKLSVYEAATTTYRPIFSDSNLTTVMANPLQGAIASDAAGNFPVFYMAAGLYKLRAVTSADVLIWEWDNLDTGTSAGAGALPIVNGGTGATTAAAARANLDVPSNSELADLASDISDIQIIVQAVVSEPQGRLSPTGDTPVISIGVAAGTSVFLTGGYVQPVWDGAQFVARTFNGDLILALNSNHVANGIYDNFVIWDTGALVHVTGPVWNAVTAGSGARGTGAGTTELELVNGLLVNKYAMTARNGATLYTVDARKATYRGSTYIDGTAGQITCNMTYGQSRKWSVWNAHNRVPIALKAGDATATWNYVAAAGTFRAANANTANSLTLFTGLPEELFFLAYSSSCGTGVGTAPSVGIGYNSTSTTSGFRGVIYLSTAATMRGEYQAAPAIGINVITALESSGGTGSNAVFSGTESYCLLSAMWRG